MIAAEAEDDGVMMEEEDAGEVMVLHSSLGADGAAGAGEEDADGEGAGGAMALEGSGAGGAGGGGGALVTESYRRVRCPNHRYTPLREQWESLVHPLVEYMRLQVRFNTKNRCVELKTSEETEDGGAVQKGADFVQAFMMGFEVQDAVALLRLDDLYIDTFQVTDVKLLHGDHLSRAIGRIAGQDGKTKNAIENATRTRIVVADQRIHILGSFSNIKLARDAICALIMGAPPGKVYNQMRNVSRRLTERI